MLFGLFLARHAEHDADHRNDARQRGRGKQVEPAARRADVGQTDDPARDGRAENRAQHDGDRLPDLHHTGVDEADDHDGRCRRRLDHSRHTGAEQEALERISCQTV